VYHQKTDNMKAEKQFLKKDTGPSVAPFFFVFLLLFLFSLRFSRLSKFKPLASKKRDVMYKRAAGSLLSPLFNPSSQTLSSSVWS